MKRRSFIKTASIAGIGISVLNYSFLTSCKHGHSEIQSTEFRQLAYDLLTDWCDGMINNRIISPENLQLHGALGCPSCEHIHGRCMDAVYPFLHPPHPGTRIQCALVDKTYEQRKSF